jgi:SAM-dependent methyltransferase
LLRRWNRVLHGEERFLLSLVAGTERPYHLTINRDEVGASGRSNDAQAGLHSGERMSADLGATSRLKSWRETFLDRHSSMEDWRNKYFSGVSWALWRAAMPLMTKGCRGLVLDAGAGRSGWRSVVLRTASGYESLDLAPRGGKAPDWLGDLTAMPQVPTHRFDSLVCHQVLEHVKDPMAAAKEMARVLKPEGLAVISVPHLSRRHELPHDYYRFTPEGLRHVLESAGFVVKVVKPYGGCLSFLHHQASTAILSPTAMVPVLGDLLAAAMAPISVLVGAMDRCIDLWSLAPAGVVVLAEAPGGPAR